MVAEIPLDLVHPAVRRDIAAIDELIVEPRGILLDHPELTIALVAQRDFLALREQIVSFNTSEGTRSALRLMRKEGGEVVDIFLRSIVKGPSYVDGAVSFESVDWEIFASLFGALAVIEGKKIGKLARAEIAMGMAGIRLIQNYFPAVNIVEKLPEKVGVNESNWPARPLKAPWTWTKPIMDNYHREITRPAFKALRDTMPGGKRVMHPEVAASLEDGVVIPPTIEGSLAG